jgi:phosphoglycolate phosphatase
VYKVILFDLDGTLTDPQEGITRSIQYGLSKMNIYEDNYERLLSFIGPPLMRTFKEGYCLSDEAAAQALQFYRERFSTVGLFENAVYPGIAAMLAQLKQQGKRLFVATSKPTEFSVRILEHFGLAPFFDAIIGSNLDGTRVEKDEVIEAVLAELGPCDRSQIVMVGDRKHDVLGAKRNRIASIAVTYGFGGYEELNGAGPENIVSSVQELTALLVGLCAAKPAKVRQVRKA